MNTSDEFVLLGGGGHAAVVLDAARSISIACRGFIDDAGVVSTLDVPHLGSLDELAASNDTSCPLHAAIGNNELRARWMTRFSTRPWQTIVHSTATVVPSASVGAGSFIGPCALVNARATLGRGVIVNSGSIVEHDCDIDDCAHVAPGVVMGGGVQIGRRALIGLGTRIMPNVRIGENAVIGAGSVVLHDVRAGETAYGVPARVR
ncbi:MAG: acetyltransferase [Phycisphaerales bacterium]|nr:acetyltransferase [Phycisphaerales bacterium]